MDWMNHFQLFLFDFDGVLVDTEPLHFAAYKGMCERRGVPWDWDFKQFCIQSHGKSQGIKEGLYRERPELYRQEPNWDVLTREKRAIYLELLHSSRLELMPGVGDLLNRLGPRRAQCCVVTNSIREHVEIIKSRLIPLQEIPHWLTREDYSQPKPAPDGYLKAKMLFSQPGEAVIGFEDTLKGLKSLVQAEVRAVLVCSPQSEHVEECVRLGAEHISSFEVLLDNSWSG